MGSGRIGTAPCGHAGEAIIGQYYKCLSGCDTRPSSEDDDVDFQLVLSVEDCDQCPVCGSADVDNEYALEPEYYVFHPQAPLYDTRCRSCGRVWTR